MDPIIMGNTINYYREILDIIKPLNPLIVFLHRPDIKKSFEKAFRARGDWWRELVLGVPEPYGYFEIHKYDGDESIFSGLAYEQEQMSKIFNIITGDKLKINTSDESWNSYTREIIEKAGYEYHDEESGLPPEIEKCCGAYCIQGGEDTWNIFYEHDKKQIYTSLFWPYMPMKYIGYEEFELISFPVTLQFDTVSDNIQFVVKENYDWSYNGRVFKKIKL